MTRAASDIRRVSSSRISKAHSRRAIALLKKLNADPPTALTRAGTAAKAFNPSPAFIEHVLSRYGGTRIGRQEIDGEIVEERTDALQTSAGLESSRVATAPPRLRIAVALDPPASATRGRRLLHCRGGARR